MAAASRDAREQNARAAMQALRDWPGVSLRPSLGAEAWRVLPADVQWQFSSEGTAALFTQAEDQYQAENLTAPTAVERPPWITVRQIGGGEPVK
eukprot:5854462-Prymnesium_polylepis.1